MYGPTDPFMVEDPELRRESIRRTTTGCSSFSRQAGAADWRTQLPLDDPVGARDELERLAKKGFRHFNVMAARAEPAIYDEAWEPFWCCAEEIGIPIGFHLAVDRCAARARPRPRSRRTRWSPGERRLNHPGFQLMDPIAGLIFTGVLDRHPDLKLVMAEAGLAWIPHFIQAMDLCSTA